MKNIHTLQELNLDAARYRWLREKLVTTRFEADECVITHPMLSGANLDSMVDREILLAERLRDVENDQ